MCLVFNIPSLATVHWWHIWRPVSIYNESGCLFFITPLSWSMGLQRSSRMPLDFLTNLEHSGILDFLTNLEHSIEFYGFYLILSRGNWFSSPRLKLPRFPYNDAALRWWGLNIVDGNIELNHLSEFLWHSWFYLVLPSFYLVLLRKTIEELKRSEWLVRVICTGFGPFLPVFYRFFYRVSCQWDELVQPFWSGTPVDRGHRYLDSKRWWCNRKNMIRRRAIVAWITAVTIDVGPSISTTSPTTALRASFFSAFWWRGCRSRCATGPSRRWPSPQLIGWWSSAVWSNPSRWRATISWLDHVRLFQQHSRSSLRLLLVRDRHFSVHRTIVYWLIDFSPPRKVP